MNIFDAHFHIIDPRFPLTPSQGYLPEPFGVADYLARVAPLGVRGGAVVSGSFHGYDQGYLAAALAALGPGFVGVAQVPSGIDDARIAHLAALGVRALRFNLRRGMVAGSRSEDSPGHGLEAHLAVARRAWAVARWHAEVYVDAAEIPALAPGLASLPALVIDHLGLSRRGLPHLLGLVERGARVKATGFSRGDLPVAETLRAIAAINPQALVFGTDLPSTRAPRPFADGDLALLQDALGDQGLIEKALWGNAVALYGMSSS